MNALALRIETSNYAVVNIKADRRKRVTIQIEPSVVWDADGLEELAEALLGAADILRAKGGT